MSHEGTRLRFLSDVLCGRVVALTFSCAECQGCARSSARSSAWSRTQDLLGPRLGEDIFLVSLTLDPVRDTSAALAAHRARFGVRDSWRFLTGAPGDLAAISGRLGQTADKDAHPGVIYLGDVPRAHWRKLPPNAPAAAVVLQLEALADAAAPPPPSRP